MCKGMHIRQHCTDSALIHDRSALAVIRRRRAIDRVISAVFTVFTVFAVLAVFAVSLIETSAFPGAIQNHAKEATAALLEHIYDLLHLRGMGSTA